MKKVSIDISASYFNDTIFEYYNQKSDELYSIWIEINTAFRIFQKFSSLHNDYLIDMVSPEEENIIMNDIYNYLSCTLGEMLIYKQLVTFPQTEYIIGETRAAMFDFFDDFNLENYSIGDILKFLCEKVSECSTEQLMFEINYNKLHENKRFVQFAHLYENEIITVNLNGMWRS